MSIESIGTGIKTVLQSNITTLKTVYAPNQLPESIGDFEFAIIMHMGTDYGITMGGTSSHDLHRFKIKIGLTTQDSPSAFNKILDYCEKTGSYSVYAALASDPTLDSSASDVLSITNSGQGVFEWGGTPYLGTEFDIEVAE